MFNSTKAENTPEDDITTATNENQTEKLNATEEESTPKDEIKKDTEANETEMINSTRAENKPKAEITTATIKNATEKINATEAENPRTNETTTATNETENAADVMGDYAEDEYEFDPEFEPRTHSEEEYSWYDNSEADYADMNEHQDTEKNAIDNHKGKIVFFESNFH